MRARRRRSPAVSSIASRRRLSVALVVMSHLLNRAVREGRREAFGRRIEPIAGDKTQVAQFVRLDVLSFVLRESVEENGALSHAESDNRAISAGTPASRSRHPLLDQPAAQISVNESERRALYSLAQAFVADTLAAGEPRKPSDFENPHSLSSNYEL